MFEIIGIMVVAYTLAAAFGITAVVLIMSRNCVKRCREMMNEENLRSTYRGF